MYINYFTFAVTKLYVYYTFSHVCGARAERLVDERFIGITETTLGPSVTRVQTFETTLGRCGASLEQAQRCIGAEQNHAHAQDCNLAPWSIFQKIAIRQAPRRPPKAQDPDLIQPCTVHHPHHLISKSTGVMSVATVRLAALRINNHHLCCYSHIIAGAIAFHQTWKTFFLKCFKTEICRDCWRILGTFWNRLEKVHRETTPSCFYRV